jgi:hypothetical protein
MTIIVKRFLVTYFGSAIIVIGCKEGGFTSLGTILLAVTPLVF